MTRTLRSLSPLMMLALLAPAAWGQAPATTTAPTSAPAPYAPATPWIRISTSTNQVGATAAVTIQTINTEDGTTLTQLDIGDNLRLSYQDPKTLSYLDYTAIYNEIRQADLAPWMRDSLQGYAKSVLPTLSWDAMRAKWKGLLGSNWKDVAPAQDKGLRKYDLAAENPVLAPAARQRTVIASVPDVVWVDAATGMVVKTTTKLANGAREWDVTVTYDYGIEGPADIYGANVPRDARIVDNRPSAETREVLQRIEGRIAKGFGDYVGIMTDSLMRPEGGPDPVRTSVKLLARKGSSGLVQTFAVLPRKLPNHPGIALPEKWPDVSPEELFQLARDSVPHSYVAYDNQTISAGRFLRGRMDPSYAATIERGTAVTMTSIGQYIWPNLSTVNRYTPQTQIRLVANDPGRPGLLGIEVNTYGPSNDYYITQTVYWIDPQNDDALVEANETTFRGGSALNRQAATDTRVVELAKLPDGRAYPARWTITSRRPNPDGFLDPYLQREAHLTLLPDKTFDASWVPATQPANVPKR